MNGAALIAVGLALLVAYRISQQSQALAQADPYQLGPTEGGTMGNNALIYDPSALNADQRNAADIIVRLANNAGIDPAFMLALAVTESSLRPTIVGDDGVSIGLFQLQVATAKQWDSSVDQNALLDAETNARLSMVEMLSLHKRYPGHTFGEYAEAWTLGGRGKFVLDKSNPGKQTRMLKAAADLSLTYDNNTVWA